MPKAGSPKPTRSDRPRFQRREEPALRPRPSRLRCRSIFFPKNARFPRSSNRLSNTGTLLTRYSGWHACFWERPERHRIRVRSLDNHTMIYQFGDDGPVSMDPTALERNAFNEKREEYYGTEIVEKEPIKGNFTSVAR